MTFQSTVWLLLIPVSRWLVWARAGAAATTAGGGAACLLSRAGICASSGSACLAASPDPSHVIAAMKPADAARQSIRFSLGPELTTADIATCIAALCIATTALGSHRDRESP